jgi:glycosyltransferase involved in cell wall biosynthesis
MTKLSVITVNYNNKCGLERTINSCGGQSFADFEHIVIDANSTDGSKVLCQVTVGKGFKYISEADEGIFDGMNKGIHLSKGKWVLFMNSGDVFSDENTLLRVDECNVFDDDDVDVIYGDKHTKSGEIIKSNLDLSCLYYGELPACHQSIFFRNDIEYDTSYKIFGDIDLMCKLYSRNLNFKYIEVPISISEGGGVSSIVTFQKRIEKVKSLYNNFGIICILRNYINYSSFKKIFKNLKFII